MAWAVPTSTGASAWRTQGCPQPCRCPVPCLRSVPAPVPWDTSSLQALLAQVFGAPRLPWPCRCPMSSVRPSVLQCPWPTWVYSGSGRTSSARGRSRPAPEGQPFARHHCLSFVRSVSVAAPGPVPKVQALYKAPPIPRSRTLPSPAQACAWVLLLLPCYQSVVFAHANRASDVFAGTWAATSSTALVEGLGWPIAKP